MQSIAPQVSYYSADVLTYSDYYPFGMQMPGRNGQSDEYRYGFNGMERDDEVNGEGNSYTTEFRQYDPRIACWISLDPLMAKYPHQSPFMAFNGNPIYFKDPTGLEGEGSGDSDFPENPKNGDTHERKDAEGVTWRYVYSVEKGDWVNNGGEGGLADVTLTAEAPDWMVGENSGHTYTPEDIRARQYYMQFGNNNPFKRAILAAERDGRNFKIHDPDNPYAGFKENWDDGYEALSDDTKLIMDVSAGMTGGAMITAYALPATIEIVGASIVEGVVHAKTFLAMNSTFTFSSSYGTMIPNTTFYYQLYRVPAGQVIYYLGKLYRGGQLLPITYIGTRFYQSGSAALNVLYKYPLPTYANFIPNSSASLRAVSLGVLGTWAWWKYSGDKNNNGKTDTTEK